MALLGSDTASHNFPPEFISPSAKESKEYGLQYAKAIYGCGTRYGLHTYNADAADFDALTSVAQGNYSLGDVYKMFGFPETPDPNDVTTDLAHPDIKAVNLAPKYINRAVAKMQRLNYDVGLNAVDLVSLDEKADYAATIEAFYRLRKWANDMNYDPRVLFPDLDVDALPQYPDEMLYDLATNPKIKKEISGELLMKLLFEINNFKQKMREVDWDLAVYGRGHLHCYDDPNGIPRVDRINPKFWIGSYVDNDDFEQQEYAGFYDFISVNQFIKETSNELTQDEQMAIVEQYASQGSRDIALDYRRIEDYDGLAYIPVIRFYFRSEDNRTYVLKKDDFDRPLLSEKSYNYTIPPKIKDKFDSGEYRRIDNTYTSVYGGTWVIDSECVYNYKRQEYPRQKLVNATLPIKTFATNFKEGKTVSFLSQMKEPLKMINVAWNRIKQILAEGRMGIMEIDFDQIESIALKSGGRVWTPLDVMKLFFKKQMLIKRGKTNRHDQKTMNAIETNTGGLTLTDYMEMFRMAIQMLEQLGGASIIESAEQPDRLAVKNAQLSQMTADVDMEYLFNGHEYLYQKVSHQMMLIAQGSIAAGRQINGFIPALGKVNMGFFQAPRELAYCEYGMFFTRQPSPEEWREFYVDLQIMLKDGRIGASDSAYIREIDNLKQARQILSIREQRFLRQAREDAQMNMQLQMQANSQAAADKMEAELLIMREQAAIDERLLRVEGEIKRTLQSEKEQWTSTTKRMEGQNKRLIAKQTSNLEVLKKSVENIPKKEKNLVDQQQVEVDREKVEVMKRRPVSSSK